MAESSTLKNVSIVVGIVSGVVGIFITVATFLGRDSGSPHQPTSPAATNSQERVEPSDPDSGCGAGAPAEVTLSAGRAARGSEVTVHGSCFQPDERVMIRVHATEVGSATADSNGNFTQSIIIPNSAPPPGFPTDISATGRQSVKTGTAPFQTD
jgi:hypothetical protein